jgi:hypothetical protein
MPAEPPVGGFALSIYKRIAPWQSAGVAAEMDIAVRIECTPGEARRLIGAPDLLPLHQLLALTLEDWLIVLLARLDSETGRFARAAADGEREGERSSAA